MSKPVSHSFSEFLSLWISLAAVVNTFDELHLEVLLASPDRRYKRLHLLTQLC